MSSINARVPPSRIAAIDSPADGEVAAYQASSGQFEWVANGSGGGGSVTSVALTETGTALSITGSPITGAGTFNIAGAGTSSQVILGDLSLGTLTSGTIGGSIANTQVARGAATADEIEGDNGLLFDGTSFTVNTLSVNNPVLNMSSSTKSVSLEVETSQTLSIKGGSNKFIFDASSGTGGITWPDLSTQLTANNTVGTVTGTGSANQVSYWTAASVQAGSTGLTYDPSTGNLTVGGYVEVGTKVTTPTGTDLILDTVNGTNSGSIVIADGVDGQISITPNGAGKVKLDGVEIDNSAIATGYILKASSTTAAGWAAESGGGGSSVYNPVLPATDIDTASANKLYIVSKMGLWGNSSNSYSTLNPTTDPLLWPFISPKSGDIDHISVSRAGGTTGTLGLAIYSDSNGIPGSKIGGDMSVSTTTQYIRVDTTPSSTVTLVQGTQYWLGVVETTFGNAAYTKEPTSGSKFVAPIDAATTRLDTTIVLSYGLKLNSSTSVLPSGPLSATDLEGSTSTCIRFGIVYS